MMNKQLPNLLKAWPTSAPCWEQTHQLATSSFWRWRSPSSPTARRCRSSRSGQPGCRRIGACLAALGVGMIITRGIDLSIGAVVCLVASVAASFAQNADYVKDDPGVEFPL